MTPEVSEWVAKAEGDFDTAGGTWDLASPVYDTICYHYQQCVEKYLKALILHFNESVPWIHDLRKLGKLLVGYVPNLHGHLDDLERLTDLALEVRYPGFRATLEQALEAKQTCLTIRSLCKSILVE